MLVTKERGDKMKDKNGGSYEKNEDYLYHGT